MNKQKIVAQKRGFMGTAKEGNIDRTVLSLARCEYNDSQKKSFFNCSIKKWKILLGNLIQK